MSATVETVILPLDGSTLSDRAAGHARAIARALDARIRVLHVFHDVRGLTACLEQDIEWGHDARPRGVIAPPASIRSAFEWLTNAVEDVEVIGRCGDPVDEILEEASLNASPLIVMASLGSSGLRRILMGSVANGVVRQAQCPVVVIPSRKVSAEMAEPRIERVLLLLDHESTPVVVLPITTDMALRFGAHVDVAVVGEGSPGGGLADSPRSSGSAGQDLGVVVDLVVSSLRGSGARAEAVVMADDTLRAVGDYVADRGVSLIVAATTQRSLLERLTYGSVTEDLADLLPAPLLLVPLGSFSARDA